MSREQINLIYFGRIAKSKNIDIVINVLSILISHGYNARLDLIGGYSNDYKSSLDSFINELRIPDGRVIFHGANTLEYITSILRRSHYFIFPSQEKKEGHSNSLTEAMAFGVVPIVSKAGFNESICGNKRFVVSDLSPQVFANRIIDIEQTGEWDSLSQFVFDRVMNNYTEVQAMDNLRRVINILAEN